MLRVCSRLTSVPGDRAIPSILVRPASPTGAAGPPRGGVRAGRGPSGTLGAGALCPAASSPGADPPIMSPRPPREGPRG
ncbi:hypothetical protein KRH_01580 [Kocuria rhizophila DC2201]|uniref:Uncharacterized protein n=1 Tax=Kocuria rhizophila (strain ATCC 9341 / DSM 348 / NBRC 103217 / DC2201) TaxID=378753 RepID=B2GKL4_KOCRD|nr:hypothetical protein KRH_01580 [Kocuria rhizophila DC2201]